MARIHPSGAKKKRQELLHNPWRVRILQVEGVCEESGLQWRLAWPSSYVRRTPAMTDVGRCLAGAAERQNLLFGRCLAGVYHIF